MKRKMIELPAVWVEKDEKEYDDLGIPGLEQERKILPIVIDINEITCFTESKRPSATCAYTVGEYWVIEINYEEFKRMYDRYYYSEDPWKGIMKYEKTWFET